MADFSTTQGYQPPGVYIDTDSTGATPSIGVGNTVMCLIGTGIGYETTSENFSFATSTTAVLSKQYVVPGATIVVSAQTDAGPVVYTASVGQTTNDYSVTTTNHVTTITRATSGSIPVDRPVTISYRYADDDYYALNKFTDYSVLTSIYGAPLDPVTGAIASNISFAARIAFLNQARFVYSLALDLRAAVNPAAPTPTELENAWLAAYQKLLPNYEINLVVPLWTEVDDSASAETYLDGLSSFLAEAENEGFPMIGITSVAQGYSTNDPETLANHVADRRVVLTWPQKLYYYNSALSRSTAICDGIYGAVACAATLSAQELARGLTHLQIAGFTGIPADALNVMKTSKKNLWSEQGVSVLEINRSNQLIVRHGVTTKKGKDGDREISIVRCQDAILESLQLTLESANIIGDKITSTSTIVIAGLIDGVLQGLQSDDVLYSYTTPLATQAPGPDNNPTVIKVTFSYKPTYPLNYVTVSFLLDLSTSTVTSSTDGTVDDTLTAP